MADEELRQLHAAWSASGTSEDGARYLLGMVRSGALTRDQVELAAYCGHAPALHAVERQTAPSTSVEFVLGLKDHGVEAFVTAAIAAVRSVEGVATENDRGRLPIADLLGEWLRSPDPDLVPKLNALGFVGDPANVGGSVALARWAVDLHALDFMDRQEGEGEPPATFPEQDALVLQAMREACLTRALAPW